MEIIIILAIVAALSWLNAYQCYTQRKFILKDSREVGATIISCSGHKEKRGRSETIYYDFEAKAVNGKTYCISTANRKVRKYGLYSNIIVMVPKRINSYNDFSYPEYSDGITLNKQSKTPSLYESEQLKIPCELGQKSISMDSNVNSKLKELVTIKEDVKTRFQFWLSLSMGIFFIILTVFVAVILNINGIL